MTMKTRILVALSVGVLTLSGCSSKTLMAAGSGYDCKQAQELVDLLSPEEFGQVHTMRDQEELIGSVFENLDQLKDSGALPETSKMIEAVEELRKEYGENFEDFQPEDSDEALEMTADAAERVFGDNRLNKVLKELYLGLADLAVMCPDLEAR